MYVRIYVCTVGRQVGRYVHTNTNISIATYATEDMMFQSALLCFKRNESEVRKQHLEGRYVKTQRALGQLTHVLRHAQKCQGKAQIGT